VRSVALCLVWSVFECGCVEQMGQGVYMEKIRNMFNTSRKRLLVDLTDLRNFDPDLTRRCVWSFLTS
jgi:hypothetical protein